MMRLMIACCGGVLLVWLSWIDYCFAVELGILRPPIKSLSAGWWFATTRKYSSVADDSATPQTAARLLWPETVILRRNSSILRGKDVFDSQCFSWASNAFSVFRFSPLRLWRLSTKSHVWYKVNDVSVCHILSYLIWIRTTSRALVQSPYRHAIIISQLQWIFLLMHVYSALLPFTCWANIWLPIFNFPPHILVQSYIHT